MNCVVSHGGRCMNCVVSCGGRYCVEKGGTGIYGIGFAGGGSVILKW